MSFIIRINDHIDNPNGEIVQTYPEGEKDNAVQHAKNIATSGFWFSIPVGCVVIFHDTDLRNEIGMFHHIPKVIEPEHKPMRTVVYSRRYDKSEINVTVNRDSLAIISGFQLHHSTREMLQIAVKHDIRDFTITGEKIKFVRFHTVLEPVHKQDDES